MKYSSTTTTTTSKRIYKDINILAPISSKTTTKNVVVKSSQSLWKRMTGIGIIGISLLAVTVGATLETAYADRYVALPNANPDNHLYVPTTEYIDDIDFGANANGIVSLIIGTYNADGELTGGFLGTINGFILGAVSLWNTIGDFLTGNQSELFITQFGAQRFQFLLDYSQQATPLQVYYQLTSTEKDFIKTLDKEDFTGLEHTLFATGEFFWVYRDLTGDFGTAGTWYYLWTMPSVWNIIQENW
jgi:hypothetical protein